VVRQRFQWLSGISNKRLKLQRLQQPASSPVTKHRRDIVRLDRATAATNFWQGIFRGTRWS
jgi:hypothetical protein